MDVHPAQLAALVAIVDHGTFDAAAQALHVTPSAISQRIRALEASLGQVVIERAAPCRPTRAGEVLLGLARRSELLFAEARTQLDEVTTHTKLPIAVNSDSLATWFRDVLADAAGWEGVSLHLQVDDQAHTADWLRRGVVLATVSSDPTPVQGCAVLQLGVMRYVAAASPEYADHWRGQGRTGRRATRWPWQQMPVVRFNEKDDLQHVWLAERGVAAPEIIHRVPTSHEFLEAVCVGLGWGVIPEQQFRVEHAAGRLVPLDRRHVDVPLYWTRWRLDSPTLDRATQAVLGASARALRRAPSPSA